MGFLGSKVGVGGIFRVWGGGEGWGFEFFVGRGWEVFGGRGQG